MILFTDKKIISVVFIITILLLVNQGYSYVDDLLDDDVLVEDFKNDKSDKELCTSNQKNCDGYLNNPNLKPKSEYYADKEKNGHKLTKEKISYPSNFKYEELFLQKGHEREEYLKSFNGNNYTDYFDYTVTPEEMDYIKSQQYVLIPPKKFQFNIQGNFLHFYKTAYEKKLPVLFSTDSMLYSLNENTDKVVSNFLENIFIIFLKKFLENVVEYGQTLRDDPELTEYKIMIAHSQIFFGAGASLLSRKIKDYEGPSDIDQFMKGVSELSMKYTTNTFSIMMTAKTLNTASLIPTGMWRKSQRLANLYATIKFYQLVKFDLRDEIKSIYILGKLIVDSGNKQAWNDLKNIMKYLIGWDKSVPDFVEVYELGRELGFADDVYRLSNDQIHVLSEKITNLISSHKEYMIDLQFSNDYIFYSQESYDKFRYSKEFTTSVFFRQNDLEDWITNKLLDITKDPPRALLTSIELVDSLHHASSYRSIIFNRYKGKATFSGEKMMPYRDEIDIQENFEKAKYTIKHSMEKEPINWKKNLLNHYHYLLYKFTRKIKHSSDPIFRKMSFNEKTFHATWGSFTHFKRQLLYFSENPATTPAEGEIPEVIFEPKLEFYKEMKEFWSELKKNIYTFTSISEYYVKINYKMITAQFNNIFHDMNNAIDLCIRGIKMQESGTLTPEWRERFNKLIFYDKESKTWQGWYTNLFDRDQPQQIFKLDFWTSRIANFPEMKNFQFPGAVLVDIIKYPQIGYIVVEDQYEKTKKVLLVASYAIKDMYRRLDEKVDSEQLFEEMRARN